MPRPGMLDLKRGNPHVSNQLLPDNGNSRCCPVRRRHCANLGIATRNKICPCKLRQGYIEAFRVNAGRDLDKGAVGGSEEGVGEGKNKMGRLPEAVGQTEARRQKELAIPLQMHDDLRLEGLGHALIKGTGKQVVGGIDGF